MQAKDFEFEELAIAEAIGLAFHGLDFVVDAFQGAGGDAVVVEGEDALAVFLQGAGELSQHADAGSVGAANPIVENSSGRGFVRCCQICRRSSLR